MSLPAQVTAAPAEPAPSLAEAVAAAAGACPGVVRLYGVGPAPVVTYLPGRRVAGVQVDATRIQLSVVVARGSPVVQVASGIRAALADLAAGRLVDVHVADVQDPPPALPG